MSCYARSMRGDRGWALAVGSTSLLAVVAGMLAASGALDGTAPGDDDHVALDVDELVDALDEADTREHPSHREPDGSRTEETELPSIWGPDELGASRCVQESGVFGRTITDLDDRGRIVRRRNWREDYVDGRWVPFSVMRWEYLEDGRVRREAADRSHARRRALAPEEPHDDRA